MRTRLMVVLLSLLLFSAPAVAQFSTSTDEEVHARADSAFRQGVENKTRIVKAQAHFRESTDAYLELHRREYRSAALYVNLGNAAVLADRMPRAAWAYHMALKLDPNDQTAREHLAFVRGKVLLPPAGQGRPEADAWPPWLHRPTRGQLLCLAAFLYPCVCLVAACFWINKKSQFLWLLVGLHLVFISAGIGFRHRSLDYVADRETPLVVLKANTEFYRGNAVSYPQHIDVPILPRGMEARQLHRRGNWVQLRLTTGEIGWVHAGNALVVEP